MSVRFLTFSDVHISTVNPRARRGSYLQDILDKLKQIQTVGKKLNVSFYVCAGDMFNLKTPMRNPHALNTTLIRLFKDFGAPVYTTEGNHDLRYDSYETFDEQPLSVLYESGALRQIRNEVISTNGMKIRLRGFPFEEAPDISALPVAQNDVDVNVCVLHVYATPSGGLLHKNKLYSYTQLAELGDDVYVLGHYHIDQGVQNLSWKGKERTFINLGALSRGTLIEDNISRIPRIGYIEIDKGNDTSSIKVTAVRLRVRPSSEVFDLEEKKEEERKQKEAEEFVEKLKLEDVNDDPEDKNRITNTLQKLNLEKTVLGKVTTFLDKAQEELEKIKA